jgi:hypothetical protein
MSNQNDDNAQQSTVEANQIEKALVWARRAAVALLVDANYAETSSNSGTTVAASGTYAPQAQITAVASGNVEISAHASFLETGTSTPILQISVNGGSFAPYYEWTDNLNSPSVVLIVNTGALVGQTIRVRFAAGAEDTTQTLGNGVAAVPSSSLIVREIQPV